jgi:hypothetical protein
MMRMRRQLAIVVSCVALCGCGGGGSAPATKAPDAAAAPAGTSTAAGNVAQGAAAAQQGAEKMAQGLQQATANAGKPVAFEQLAGVIGEVNGWTRNEPTGEQMNMPVAFSRAEARYQKDQSRVSVEIQDTALSQLLLAPLSMFMVQGFEERSSNGYRRYAEFRGQPAFEEWNKNSNRGELTVIVNKRFVLKGTGTRVDNIDEVKQVLGGVDMTRLASLK